MSQSEFHEWLFKAATGWLGWPPAAVLATPMPMIEAAFEGRMDMLKAIFGGAEKPNDGASFDTKLQESIARVGTDKLVRKK